MGWLTTLKGLLREYFLDAFREHPVLGPIAAIAILGQIATASINSFALSFYILDDLHQPGRVLGYLTSSYLVVEAVLKLPFGHVSDRIGRRPVIAGGLLLTIGTPLAIALLPIDAMLRHPALIYAVLLPLRVLGGAGAAAIWPPLYAEVPERVPEARRGTAMAVLNSSYALGIAAGPALAGFLAGLFARDVHSGWHARVPFLMAAVATLLAVLAAGRLPKDRERRGDGDTDTPLPSWHLIAVIVGVTTMEMFATSSLAPYLAPFMTRMAHISRTLVGYYLLVLGIPVIAIGIPAGRFVDRWPKGIVRTAALWVSAVAMWAVPFQGNIWVICALGGVVVVGFLVGAPAWLALISDLAPKGREGVVMGILATAEGAGAFAGPFVSGYLWDMNIRYPFVSSAVALTVAALVASVFVRGWREDGGGKGHEAELSREFEAD